MLPARASFLGNLDALMPGGSDSEGDPVTRSKRLTVRGRALFLESVGVSRMPIETQKSVTEGRRETPGAEARESDGDVHTVGFGIGDRARPGGPVAVEVILGSG